MDKLNRIRIFLRVAERESFSAAARDLGLTQPTVSKAISALEQGLGLRLVSRSTRNVTLTDAGRRYYERCRLALADLDAADAAVSDAETDFSGTLTVAASVPFGMRFISPRVVRFRQMHPRLQICLDLNDAALDLVKNGIDVAIRLGPLATPGLVARKLGESAFVTVASPAYLARAGSPRSLEALAEHNCLAYSTPRRPLEWVFETARGPRTVRLSSDYRSNNMLALKEAALAGFGIARLPTWMVDDELAAGTLQPLLDEQRAPAFDIHAVFPSVRQVPPRVSGFVDFLREELAAIPGFAPRPPARRKRSG